MQGQITSIEAEEAGAEEAEAEEASSHAFLNLKINFKSCILAYKQHDTAS